MYNSNNVARLLSAAGTVNNTLVTAGLSYVNRIVGYNARASAVYLKIYDKATAPVAGTDTPKMTVYLPTAQAFSIPIGLVLNIGLGFALTTGGADADTGAVTAGDILGLNILYN